VPDSDFLMLHMRFAIAISSSIGGRGENVTVTMMENNKKTEK
jgi:hypothetical protein